MMSGFLKLLACCLLSIRVAGASQDSIPARRKNFLTTKFMVPGYSPDILFSLTAGCIFSFKTDAGDLLLPRSSVPLTFTYSSAGAFIANLNLVSYWLHDRLRVNMLLQFRSLRDVYYGVGLGDGVHTAYPDSTGYRRSYLTLQFRPLWRLAHHFFGGPALDYNQNILWDVNPHMQGDGNYRRFGSYIVNAGLGGMICYDSRDFPQNAYKGLYLAATYILYGKMLGSNTRFQSLDIDLRWYLPVAGSRARLIAFNWRSRYAIGQAPFTAMASPGTPFDLRGYRYGQFRDNFLNYAIAEYRYKFYRRSGKPSPLGFVLWTGAGAIGPNPTAAAYRQVLPNAGVGLRYEIQPRLNVRVDFGVCPYHAGAYVNFSEAF